jgi:hypothetical protein
MEPYGHEEASEAEQPTPLEEVAVVADAATLRQLAKFLLHVANQIDAHGGLFGHEHFEDFDPSVQRKPRFVVSRPGGTLPLSGLPGSASPLALHTC